MQPVNFSVESSPPTVVVVTMADGREFEIKLAQIVGGVLDSGLINPLDGCPILAR